MHGKSTRGSRNVGTTRRLEICRYGTWIPTRTVPHRIDKPDRILSKLFRKISYTDYSIPFTTVHIQSFSKNTKSSVTPALKTTTPGIVNKFREFSFPVFFYYTNITYHIPRWSTKSAGLSICITFLLKLFHFCVWNKTAVVFRHSNEIQPDK